MFKGISTHTYKEICVSALRASCLNFGWLRHPTQTCVLIVKLLVLIIVDSNDAMDVNYNVTTDGP